MLRLLREAHPLLWEPCDHGEHEDEDPQQVSVESVDLDHEFGNDTTKDKDKSSKGLNSTNMFSKVSSCLRVGEFDGAATFERMKPSKNLHNCLEMY